jgi:hypothetical protein
MDGGDGYFFGIVFAAIGVMGVVLGVKRRDVFFALLGLVCVAFGLWAVMGVYTRNTFMSALVLLLGMQNLAFGIKGRSRLTVLAAIAVIAGGAGGLAHLYSWETLWGALIAAWGVWGLLHVRGPKKLGAILYRGGFGAIGIGFLTSFDLLLFLGSIAGVVGVFMDGFRLPSSGDQQTPEADTGNQQT